MNLSKIIKANAQSSPCTMEFETRNCNPLATSLIIAKRSDIGSADGDSRNWRKINRGNLNLFYIINKIKELLDNEDYQMVEM